MSVPLPCQSKICVFVNHLCKAYLGITIWQLVFTMTSNAYTSNIMVTRSCWCNGFGVTSKFMHVHRVSYTLSLPLLLSLNVPQAVPRIFYRSRWCVITRAFTHGSHIAKNDHSTSVEVPEISSVSSAAKNVSQITCLYRGHLQLLYNTQESLGLFTLVLYQLY